MCDYSLHGLPKGKYTLTMGGQEIGTATEDLWNRTMMLPSLQCEKLREKIIAKNRLYFHRWRPQNETYLFGFRKDEQAKNAKEIPEFDPLIEKLEAEIAKLRKPATQTWELVRKEEKK